MNFRFQPKVCDDSNGMTQKSMNFDGTVIVTVKGHDCRIKCWFMPKDEAVDRMKNANVCEKSGQL